MTSKQYAIIGFLAPTIFWITYFVMANQRPEYSFLTKAMSELGSIDAKTSKRTIQANCR
jgi:hypothetical membrane protein